jgi:aspartyl-tRNA(Asn)/glutamyl-tRNA(Gln) amidotransferase subunit B
MVVKGKNGEYEVVIGLEVHAQMSTKTKLFSNAPVKPLSSQNTCVDLFDLALPGTLPVLNFKAIELAVKTGLAVRGTINRNSHFDRKHYFYPDLPSGYQITQFFEPIVRDGSVEIDLEDGRTKMIRIRQIHVEQDAGKLLHDQDPKHSFVDFNRAGVPLMEIVSQPDISSPEEAVAYVKNLQAILRDIGTSDADMEKGNFRCDVNVSIHLKGAEEYGTRTETKNLNSYDSIKKAIEYEVKRHLEIIENGGKVEQQTRLFDTATGKTNLLRGKEDAIDYRYFPDPDLRPVVLDEAFVEAIRAKIGKLPLERKRDYIKYGLGTDEATLIAYNSQNSAFYEALIADGIEPKIAANWLIVELFARLNKSNQALEDCKVSVGHLSGLIKLIIDETISGKIAKDVLDEMFETGHFADAIVEAKGLKQITNTKELEEIVGKVIASSPKQVEAYRGGQEKMFGFFVGQVMKETGGKANPQLINEILKKLLSAAS